MMTASNACDCGDCDLVAIMGVSGRQMEPHGHLEAAEERLAVSDRVRHAGANSMLMAWIAKRPGMTRWKWNWGRNEHHENSNRQSRGNCLPRNPDRKSTRLNSSH